jgi:hypothetical protein
MFQVSAMLRRLLGAALTAPLVALLVAAPVAADVELGHKGHVGYHALVDTETKPGANCVYRTITERDSDYEPGMIYWEGRLARLEVKPPVMRSGRPYAQKVSWRFIVQRSKDGGTWKPVYRSPLQVRTVKPDRDARFLPMAVGITVPRASRHENHHQYRVLIKMAWYRPDGTVEGSARHQLSWYGLILRGQLVRTWIPNCDAWSAWLLYS